MSDIVAYALHNSAKISPKKAMIVADLIRGCGMEQAKVLLAFDGSKAAHLFLKVVKSAIANAKNNKNIKTDLFLKEVYVHGGPTLRRGRIVAKSRMNPILKRTSHLYVGLATKGGK